MKKLALPIFLIATSLVLGLVISPLAACHTQAAQQATTTAVVVATDAGTCAQAEASAVAAGTSVLDVYHLVETAIALYKTGGWAAVENRIEQLIAQYGEPIVACTVVKVAQGSAAPASSAGSGSGTPDAGSATKAALVAASAGESPEVATARIQAADGSPEAVARELAIVHQWAAP